MFPRMRRVLPLALLVSSSASGNGQFCHPPHFGGIVPGITEDRDVVALHGEGFFAQEIGESGGRYYTDSTRSMTLLVIIGRDNVIESVELSNGSDLPFTAPTDLSPYVSGRLDASDHGRLHIGLGATMQQVKNAYGPPAAQYQGGVNWYYPTSTASCATDASVNFLFTGDRVTRVAFFNGD